jgi:hypothetical protein
MSQSDNEYGREGPRVTIERSCQGCRWVLSSSYLVYCGHPSRKSCNLVGDSTWRTPDWCPVLVLQMRPNDGQSGRCGIRISGDAWCVLDVGHEGEHV